MASVTSVTMTLTIRLSSSPRMICPAWPEAGLVVPSGRT